MKSVIVALIRLYQLTLSPFIQVLLISVFGVRMRCKYPVTCSEYTILQVKKHGTITGLKQGVARILSCH